MAIAEAVKQIPPEAVEDIFANGIVLSGGGSELYGIDILVSKVLGISVTRAINPMDCVAKGLARINAFLPARMKAENKNITDQVSKYYESSKNAKGV